ncbi:MAG: hypothetical protein ACOCYP_00960 [Planctomycetota bacterium]
MRLRCALACLALCLSAGCGEPHRHPPHLQITVVPDSTVYVLNGRKMGKDQLWRELEYIAERNRNAITGSARARVAVQSQRGLSDRRVQQLTNYLISLGLDKIYYPGQ